MQTFQYTRHQKKEILIDFLSRRFPYQNRENWLKNIATGLVKVNHKKAAPNNTLNNKDIISYERPRSDEPEVDTRYQILYQDDVIIVVNKSGMIPISESGKYYRNTLLNVLKEKENFKELFAVHRLDKETSGVVVIAKDARVATLLGQQFVKGVPEKFYHAVLLGTTTEDSIEVDQPIKKSNLSQSIVRIRQVVSPEGKPSKTIFYPIKSSQELTLARIQTFSGRTHQIRCHAEFIKLPILGDKLYGQSDQRFLALLNKEEEPVFKPYGKIERQLLHASSISFFHPITNEKVFFEADFKQAFSKYPFFQSVFPSFFCSIKD